jgi:hypothetical protein
MDKKWVLSKLFLAIGGMQNARQSPSSEKSSACCLLAVGKSANSEESSLTAVYYIRNLPTFQQPISNKPMIFPMMTIVEHFASRLSTKIISIKPTFYP